MGYTELIKREMHEFAFVDFNAPLTALEKSSKQEINEDILALNETLEPFISEHPI